MFKKLLHSIILAAVLLHLLGLVMMGQSFMPAALP